MRLLPRIDCEMCATYYCHLPITGLFNSSRAFCYMSIGDQHGGKQFSAHILCCSEVGSLLFRQRLHGIAAC